MAIIFTKQGLIRNFIRKRRWKGIIKLNKYKEVEEPFELCFSSFEDAYYGKIGQRSICQAVFRNDTVFKIEKYKFQTMHLIVQWEKTTSNQETGIYSANELFKLKLICQAISSSLDKIIVNLQLKNAIERSFSAIKMFKDISIENNLASIWITVQEWIPKIFHAKKACIFFIDHKDPSYMFTCSDIGEDEKGTKFIKNILKFPSTLGYTGNAYIHNEKLIYTPKNSMLRKNPSEREVDFKEEFDNHVCESIVKWALYNPLKDETGKIQGVLQIINKETEGDLLNENNTLYLLDYKLDVLSEIIGTAIRNAITSTNIMALSYSMQKGINSVSFCWKISDIYSLIISLKIK